jgi:ChrB-like protein
LPKTSPKWLVLAWRLPAGSSTPRVATWRSLRRLGAISLTPGAVILPYSEQLLEQLEWIADEIVQRAGDAYVLPVTELAEAEEEDIRRRMREGAKMGAPSVGLRPTPPRGAGRI